MKSVNGSKRSCKRVPKQLELDLPTWGGARKGSGRKRVAAKKRVRHRKRERYDKAHPVHVTLRVREGVPSLRTREAWGVVVRVMRAARMRHGLSVHQYSLLGNHLHMIVEHDGGDSLCRGMRALCTMLAARLNAHFGRSGPLLADRYHARALTTPLEVRRAIAYVLLNYRKHAGAEQRFEPGWVDRFSTAPKFDGWRTPLRSRFADFDYGTAPARTWLLSVGWQRHGLLALDETPVDAASPLLGGVRAGTSRSIGRD